MNKERKAFARYFIVRGHQSLWKGDPAEDGAQFRTVVITSNEFNWTDGTFQVYGLEGIGRGIKDGALVLADEEPMLLFDKEFQGLDAAGKKFSEVIKESEAKGFRRITMFDEIEFQAKLSGAK